MGRFYFGWYVVVAAIVVYTLIVGTTFSAFGLFVLPVSEDFKLSRAEMNTALILLNLGNALMAPFVGRALDRFPARYIMIGSAVIFGLSMVGLGLSHSIWVSAAILALPLAASFQGAGAITMSVFVARWFNAQRGRAMALALMGISLGGVVAAPAMGFLIEAEGWRAALVTAGTAVGVLILLLAFTLRERPRPGESDGPAAVATGTAAPPPPAAAPMSMGALLRAPRFWLIALGIALALGVTQAITITLVPLAREEGISLMQATTLVSAAGGAAMVGKLLLAVVADRIDRTALLTILIGLGVLMNLALLYSESYATLLGSAVVLGLTTGAITPAYYALLADEFGVASFGTVRGLLAPIASLGGVAAVRIAGEVFDRTGGYEALFAGFIVVDILAAIFIFAVRFAPRTTPTPAQAPAAA